MTGCSTMRLYSSRRQAVVGKFLESFKEFPPSQKSASFSIDQVLDKLRDGAIETNAELTETLIQTTGPHLSQGGCGPRLNETPVQVLKRESRTNPMKSLSRREFLAVFRRRWRDVLPAGHTIRRSNRQEDLHHSAYERHALGLHRHGAGRGLHAVHTE